jgi:gliding motility-associated-like protein
LNISDPNLYITDLSGFAGPVFYTLGNGDTLAAPNGPYTYSDTGNYEITQYLGDLSACWDSSSISIRVDPGYKIYIPSAFSPNDDQINNRFRAYGEDISSYRLLIYNRWGELLYESYDLENGWDGRDLVSNNLAPGGVYVYKIDLKDKYQLNHYFIGNVMLVR